MFRPIKQFVRCAAPRTFVVLSYAIHKDRANAFAQSVNNSGTASTRRTGSIRFADSLLGHFFYPCEHGGFLTLRWTALGLSVNKALERDAQIPRVTPETAKPLPTHRIL